MIETFVKTFLDTVVMVEKQASSAHRQENNHVHKCSQVQDLGLSTFQEKGRLHFVLCSALITLPTTEIQT